MQIFVFVFVFVFVIVFTQKRLFYLITIILSTIALLSPGGRLLALSPSGRCVSGSVPLPDLSAPRPPLPSCPYCSTNPPSNLAHLLEVYGNFYGTWPQEYQSDSQFVPKSVHISIISCAGHFVDICNQFTSSNVLTFVKVFSILT